MSNQLFKYFYKLPNFVANVEAMLNNSTTSEIVFMVFLL